MYDYLLNTMNEKENGLYLCELPTGNGKTYASAQAMKKLAESIDDNRKIIFLTTMNKNLPEDALKVAYGNEDSYNQNVLRIRSNFDEVEEKILTISVPDEMKTENFQKLSYDVSLYKKAIEGGYSDKDYIEALKNRIVDGGKNLRNEIRERLRKNFRNKKQRKEAIKTDKQYQWIGELYPAVFTEDHKILLMSISKFMKKNSILIDSSYDFLESDLIKNAVIIIDEFDATKKTILDEIIDKSLATKEGLIQLFRQINDGLNLDDFDFQMKQAIEEVENSGNKYTFNTLMDESKEIVNDYFIRLSMKTKSSSLDQTQTFMFNDGSFQTIAKNGERYIRTTLNEEENRLDIFVENKEDYNKNHTSNDIVIYGLLRRIHSFLNHFQQFTREWARHYMNIVNDSRNDFEDAMCLEDAISSILRKLNLSRNQRDLLMGERCQMVKRNQEMYLNDLSFYQNGMEYYELEDNDSHYDNTNLNFVRVFDTPEKVILYLSEIATVIGISATAEFNTVVGNYDLNYFETMLKDNFHKTPMDLKERTKIDLEKRWSAYEEGKIKVHSEIISNNIQGFDSEEYLRSFMDAEIARYASNCINNVVDKDYEVIRYCNVLQAMCLFNENANIQSMLYLGMPSPKKNDPSFDKTVLRNLFEFSKESTKNENSSICFLVGDNFEKDKESLLKQLSQGEKIFVISSYQTIGAGQNLQYEIPEGNAVVRLGEFVETDKRFFSKDFDALYLGKITNMTINTYRDEKITNHDLLEMLFQIEELYENGELNFIEKKRMVKLAFGSYTQMKGYAFNELYTKKSVILQASKMVLQAIGRMCRTFVKNPDIYLFIESELLDQLYVGDLEKRILSPEMKSIVSLRKSLGKDYLPEENVVLNKAEKISSVGSWYIRRILSKNWTTESMGLWEQLRILVLKYPTASKSEWESNEYLKKFYITSKEKRNQYFYSQYSDFSDVTIYFGNDKIEFENSNRVKKDGEDRIIILEMSEKDSGLQAILKYPGMKEYFEENGFATEFKLNDYLMSPILFHNIYKGALGEVAGQFILKKELGIELKPITNPKTFEFFDFQLKDDVYVDFKNWKFTYIKDQDEIRKNILKKMEFIGAKRVYIINIVSNKNYQPSKTVDQRLIEIPVLIDEQGRVNYKNLQMIMKEDFEDAHK